MSKTSKKLIITLIGILFVISLFSEEEGKYAEGTIFFRVYSDFTYIEVDGNGIIETDQEWFNVLSNQFSIYEMIWLFPYSNKADFQHYYSCMFPDSLDIDEVKFAFKAKGSYVENAYKDIAIQPFEVPNDEYYNYQWPLDIVQAEDAWDVDEPPSEQIIVAVVDTGVDLCDPLDPDQTLNIHPDLTDNILKDEFGEPIDYNVFSPQGFPWRAYDDIGHGTHVAGIVAATCNNYNPQTQDYEGIASLCGWHENIKIMPVKIMGLNSPGGGLAGFGSRAATGIDWAAGSNPYGIQADIINMSWGSQYPLNLFNEDDERYFEFISTAVSSAITNGSICVASAGNNNIDYSSLVRAPASLPGVINVAASDINDEKTFYSTYANWVSITAPGGEKYYDHDENGFLSTLPQHYNYSYCDNNEQEGYGYWSDHNYDFMTGTSMSAPLVSSLIALMKAKFSDYDNDQIKERLYATADDLNIEPLYSSKLGAGRINAYRALADEEHPNLSINEIWFDNRPYIEAFDQEINVSIALKNWWIANPIGSEITVSIQGEGIETVNNTAFWDVISQYGIELNLGSIILSEETGEIRDVDLQLNFEITQEDEIIHSETMIVIVEVRTETGDNGELISTELTIEDIDNDGLDEILVGATHISGTSGSVYLYDNNNFSQLPSFTNSISSKIATADLIYENDGKKEIIAVDRENILYIWDNEGNMISSIEIDCNIVSFAVEDINGDGQIDIVGTGNEPACVFIISSNFGNPDPIYVNMGIEGIIMSDISIANVDNDPEKEGIFLFHNTTSNDLYLCKLSNITRHNYFILSEIIFTPPSPEDFESYAVSNILLIKRSLNNNVYHSIVFGLTIEEDDSGSGERSYDYYTYCYDFNNDMPTLVWTSDMETQGGVLPSEGFVYGNIIAGDFYSNEEGIEIITSTDEKIINIESGETSGYVYEIEMFQTDIFYKPTLIVNSNNSDNEIFIRKANKIKSYDSYQNILYDHCVTAQYDIVSMGIGNVYYSDVNDCYYITENGSLGRIYLNIDNDLLTEWSQYQNNSRNTGSYYQPIPETIYSNLTVKHDVIIDKDVNIVSSRPLPELVLEEGVEVRFEHDTGIHVEGKLTSNGTEDNPVVISGLCGNETSDYWDGIDFTKSSESSIERTVIQNANKGISYNECFQEHNLDKNEIKNNEIGISFYNSSFCINENYVWNNEYGVECHKEASPLLGFPDPVIPDNGHNGVMNNNVGIYVYESCPSLENGLNDLGLNEILNMEISHPLGHISAKNNWWGTDDLYTIKSLIDQDELVNFIPFCTESQTNYSREDQLSVFQQAYIEFSNKNFYNAVPLFEQVIDDSLETIEDPMSVAGLFSCNLATNNMVGFKVYLEERLESELSEIMEKTFNNYLALSNRTLENFNEPIEYYENILLNDPTYEDSCYAVIDIGNTYLEANGRASGRLDNFRPLSWESHQETTNSLLESIRTGNHIEANTPSQEHCKLYHNYPNPFNPITTFSFSIPNKSKVNLSIYNIKGQKVRSLANDEFEKGYHKLIWDGKNTFGKEVSSGVYMYKLDVAGKTKAVKKCLLLK